MIPSALPFLFDLRSLSSFTHHILPFCCGQLVEHLHVLCSFCAPYIGMGTSFSHGVFILTSVPSSLSPPENNKREWCSFAIYKKMSYPYHWSINRRVKSVWNWNSNAPCAITGDLHETACRGLRPPPAWRWGHCGTYSRSLSSTGGVSVVSTLTTVHTLTPPPSTCTHHACAHTCMSPCVCERWPRTPWPAMQAGTLLRATASLGPQRATPAARAPVIVRCRSMLHAALLFATGTCKRSRQAVGGWGPVRFKASSRGNRVRQLKLTKVEIGSLISCGARKNHRNRTGEKGLSIYCSCRRGTRTASDSRGWGIEKKEETIFYAFNSTFSKLLTSSLVVHRC